MRTIHDQAQKDTWVDNIAIQAMANVIGQNINIYNGELLSIVTPIPGLSTPLIDHEINTQYVNGNHYQALIADNTDGDLMPDTFSTLAIVALMAVVASYEFQS